MNYFCYQINSLPITAHFCYSKYFLLSCAIRGFPLQKINLFNKCKTAWKLLRSIINSIFIFFWRWTFRNCWWSRVGLAPGSCPAIRRGRLTRPRSWSRCGRKGCWRCRRERRPADWASRWSTPTSCSTRNRITTPRVTSLCRRSLFPRKLWQDWSWGEG